ncbi:hypothetical protein F7018_07450 [Tenacibaculum aiptasiae]|uniref:Uncharacterized protein n=1 Tax=Tenacibaculum aiptasiae TaxID=426481 RepID=A0A7J5AMX5_9FLAO|nr:hypothetical protein [Tenacibaculum aiptasiae]KAB1158932.1 hypothetical protein F7018_07450 [Tenacibaculum aiptasiae]
MKRFLFIFLISLSSFSQNQEKDLNTFSDAFCSCMEKQKGNRTDVWKKCTEELTLKKPGLLRKIGDGLKGNDGNLNQEFWNKINKRLTFSCDRYNQLIVESFIDKNQKFNSLIINLGNEACKKFDLSKPITKAKAENIIIPLLKKNQNKLMKKFRSPNEAVGSLNNYLALKCTSFRNYYSRVSSINKKQF